MDPDEPLDTFDVPAPTVNSGTSADVDEAMRLLAWARREGHAIKSLQVGNVILNGVSDLRPRFGQRQQPQPAPTIWEEFGMPRDDGA